MLTDNPFEMIGYSGNFDAVYKTLLGSCNTAMKYIFQVGEQRKLFSSLRFGVIYQTYGTLDGATNILAVILNES